LAANTIVLPTSFKFQGEPHPLAVGEAALLGQNGETCFTRPTISCVFVLITTVSGVKLEQTYPHVPSGEKIVMPGPFGTVMRVFSSYVWPSRTAT
jgi:hypothetical protein